MSYPVSPEFYTNRELSWLKFNERVLEEAECEDTPLFERLTFVSIFNSNLDEFFMIRVGSLYDQSLLKGKSEDSKTGMTTNEQLQSIYKRTAHLLPRRDSAYNHICKKLEKHSLVKADITSLPAHLKNKLRQDFNSQIKPLLSPQIIRSKHPFPHLNNKSLYVAGWLKSKTKETHYLGIIPIDKLLPRIHTFFENSKTYYILIEEIISHFIEEIFNAYMVVDRCVIKVIRNADIEVNEGLYDEDIDYRELMQEIIKKRNKAAAVRLDISNKVSKQFKELLQTKLQVSDAQTFINLSPLDISYIGTLKNLIPTGELGALINKPMTPQANPMLNNKEPIFKQIFKHDILINVPYESIEPILRLLKAAAYNKNVVSIQTTLYRLSTNSRIIPILEEAANNGKAVTALVELKARFDESNNIEWSKRLENAGCNILYGIDEYKVHSKIILITINDNGHIRRIAYIGTGNFNETTAKLYTDVGIITADRDICNDADKFFKNVTVMNVNSEYEHLLVAPLSYKTKLIERIDKEIEYHNANGGGEIICKFNSLTDKDLIDKFYDASQAGVNVKLIIRGICCLKPAQKGLSENIRVISIVGRFLEHSRIYYFGHTQNNSSEIIIGSGDLMTRNTERRVEIAVVIKDLYIKRRLIEMLLISFSDNVKARELMPDGNYKFVSHDENDELINSQEYFYNQAVSSSIKYKGSYSFKSTITKLLLRLENWLSKLRHRLES